MTRRRRVAIAHSSLTTLGLFVGAVVAGVYWEDVDVATGVGFVASALIVFTVGAVLWRRVRAAETAARHAKPEGIPDESTARVIVIKQSPMLLNQRSHSTVYMPRAHPLEPGRKLQMWSELRPDATGEFPVQRD